MTPCVEVRRILILEIKKELLAKQAALRYNLLRKVIGIEISDCPQLLNVFKE